MTHLTPPTRAPRSASSRVHVALLAGSLALTSLVFASRDAHAQFYMNGPSGKYQRGSVSLLADNAFALTVNQRDSGTGIVGGAQPLGSIGLSATLRIVVRRLLLQPSFGFIHTFGPTILGVPTSADLFTPGFAIGAAIAITPNFSLSPMGRIAFSIPSPANYWDAYLLGELPFTIHIGTGGILEPYVNAGVLLRHVEPGAGRSPYTDGYFVIGAGYRLGVTF